MWNMNQTSKPGCDRTDRVINIGKWGETHVIWTWWGEESGQFITRRGGARCNVLCFTAQGVCLVFRSHLCLISPAVQHQPPPTCDGHTTCHPHMRHGAWGEGSTCGISPVTRITNTINEWLSRVVTCSRDGVLRAWHIICDVVSELVTQVWRKQDRSDHLICCIVTRSITWRQQTVGQKKLWPMSRLASSLLFTAIFLPSECGHLTLHLWCQVIWHSDL